MPLSVASVEPECRLSVASCRRWGPSAARRGTVFPCATSRWGIGRGDTPETTRTAFCQVVGLANSAFHPGEPSLRIGDLRPGGEGVRRCPHPVEAGHADLVDD